MTDEVFDADGNPYTHGKCDDCGEPTWQGHSCYPTDPDGLRERIVRLREKWPLHGVWGAVSHHYVTAVNDCGQVRNAKTSMYYDNDTLLVQTYTVDENDDLDRDVFSEVFTDVEAAIQAFFATAIG